MALGLWTAGAAPAQTGDSIAEGRVRRPGDQRPEPVAGQWVVLHRVGTDRAGPLDSIRSDAAGRFRFRYRRSGSPDALYFVSSTYRGIAYFSSPLRTAVARGGDADLLVYDTTTNAGALRVQGRHLVVSGLRDGRREVAEVFELENDGKRTIVPRDATHPAWFIHFPAGAESLKVVSDDVSAGAVSLQRGRGEVYAPISPGVRQLVVTYRLPPGAFPLSLPMEQPVALLEVLTEEPRGVVEGATLAETSAAQIDGRLFRRYVAQNVAASAVVRVSVPAASEGSATASIVLALAMAAAMGGALVWRSRRRAASTAAPIPAMSPAERLVAELAALDARFERSGGDAADRREYERARADLKSRVSAALADELAAPRGRS